MANILLKSLKKPERCYNWSKGEFKEWAYGGNQECLHEQIEAKLVNICK